MSKHVTFLIGNGFDVNIGLSTRYTDFYKIYTEIKPSDSNVIQRFKRELLRSEAHGWKDWKDFELGMGKQSTLFAGETQSEDFIECFDDFAVSFNKYLLAECAKINWDNVNTSIIRPFLRSIRFFYKHITIISQDDVHNLVKHSSSADAKVRFLQFNYTDAFDKLVEKSNISGELKQLSGTGRYEINTLGENLHVHGNMNRGYPAIGVNDGSQITNETIKNDPRIQRIFIKPNFLDALQKRNVNQKIPRVSALQAINESSIICAFGVSFGDTDKYWWEKIGEWLKRTKGILIIFDICGSADDGISPLAFLDSEMNIDDRRSEIINRFMRLADLGSEWLASNPNRIIVELDSQMFNFKLPLTQGLELERKKLRFEFDSEDEILTRQSPNTDVSQEEVGAL